MMQTTDPVRPWYREPWPWILIGLPGSVVVASFVTFYLAAHNADGLVVDDYYKEGLTINRTLGRQHAARQAGLRAELEIQEGGAVLRLFANPGVALPSVLQMHVAHPTRAELDQVVKLERTGDDYRGVMHPLAAGRWQLVVEDEAKTWRLARVQMLPTGAPVNLVPGD